MDIKVADNQDFIESDIVINDTKFHIKSIFSEKTNINTAIKNIVIRKITLNKSG